MSTEEVPEMTFSSSPLQYPVSSSPAPVPVKQKRRLFQTLDRNISSKKPKLAHVEDDITLRGSVQDVSVAIETVPEIAEPEIEQPPQIERDIELDLLQPTREAVPSAPLNLGKGLTKRFVELKTSSGKTVKLYLRKKAAAQTYESLIAERSVTAPGRAQRAYYGVDIQQLIDEARINQELAQAEKDRRAEQEEQNTPQPSVEKTKHDSQMWTEKYRAKKFTELVGDERTHRAVLKWLKAWDKIVFPGSVKAKQIHEDYEHRKIMLLTGPPGLGKTTLAHVCAKQAGYEVLEINASDDRSRDVVKGRIKDALGTENVRGIQEAGKRKAGRPVCVIVDEVDGVVTGSGGSGGEGGFMKALIDLVQLDQKNSQPAQNNTAKGKRKGDKFKFLRPLILICNDVYAPSLRPLRQSALAEIIHVRKPTIDKVISRLKMVFEKENVVCDNDAVRRLCEDAWGLGSRKNSSVGARGSGDGDIRGVLVQGEWMAHKLKLDSVDSRLTRKWVESQLSSSTKSRAGPRGGTKEVLDRVFLEGAGLPNLPTTLTADEQRQFKTSKNAIGVSDLRKRSAITALREMIDTTGDHDRLVADCFASYGTRVYQDDTFLSKPNASYDWLHFHDSLSSRIFSGQEWELNPYLSTSACAYHDLFASVGNATSVWTQDSNADGEEHPFSGLKADYAAYEAEKACRTTLTELQGNFSAELLRYFSSPDTIAMELIPNVSRVLCPDVKPVVVGGSGTSVASVRKESERNCVRSSVRVMNALGVAFEKIRIETEGYGNAGFALRMEPPIDTMGTFHSTSKTAKSAQTVRYAVRQVLDQELRKEKVLQASMSRQARGSGALLNAPEEEDKENDDPKVSNVKVKRDFFGRPIAEIAPVIDLANAKIDASTIAKSTATKGRARSAADGDDRVWVSFNEGFSNAVRKPITMKDLLDGF